jgi:hypothetical protein
MRTSWPTDPNWPKATANDAFRWDDYVVVKLTAIFDGWLIFRLEEAGLSQQMIRKLLKLAVTSPADKPSAYGIHHFVMIGVLGDELLRSFAAFRHVMPLGFRLGQKPEPSPRKGVRDSGCAGVTLG